MEKASSRFIITLKRLKSEAGPPAPCKPERLSLNEIKTAEGVFQARDVDRGFLATDSHIKSLKEAVKERKADAFEALPVWWSGRHWYVIDGHHRLMALRAAQADAATFIGLVPVEVFVGSVEEAIAQAVALNSKDKLPMTKADKLDRAWKLVCLGGEFTKEQIANATTVSPRTVANMRARHRELLQEGEQGLLDWTWRDVLANARPLQEGDDWKMREALKWQRLLVKHFGKKFAELPEIAAMALQSYSERLPEELIRYWPDEARRVLEEEEDQPF